MKSQDESKTLIKEIERLKNANQKCEEIISSQKAEINHSHDYQKFLSQITLKLEELLGTDYYDFIAETLHKLIEDSIIIISRYDNASDNFYVGAVAGLDENAEEFIKKYLGHNFKIIDFHEIDEEYVLKVCDTGVGFPEDIDFRNTKSLGLQLVNNLVGKIDGTIELDRSHGTGFTIKFKELEL